MAASNQNLESLDRNQAQPLYQQIKSKIRTLISSGAWRYGVRVPSENELVAELGVSRMTINRALRELTQENVLHRIHGVGTFVAEPRRHASLIQLQDIADEVRASGHRYAMQLVDVKGVRAGKQMAAKMDKPAGSELFELTAIHCRDDIPIQFEHRHVNPDLVPDFLNVDFSSTTATSYLIDLIKPDEMEHIVQAIMPGKRIARLLSIPVTEPCLSLSRRTWKDHRVVTQVELIYPSSRYDLGQRYSTQDFIFR